MAVAAEDNVQAFAPSADEVRNGKYAPETLVKVLSAMNQDGLVVLKNVIPVDIIDKLNKRMCAEADERIADPSQAYNHGIKSNILQRPPTVDSEYLSKDIYFNTFLLQLANAYLGHRPTWNWLTANTALAGTPGVRQPAHKDNTFPHPLFPYFFIANVPLCDFSRANGATEFWLGSHAATTTADQPRGASDADRAPYPGSRPGDPLPRITEAALERRRAVRPPVQPECCRGDIMVRDLRTWHAGMPNESNEHRVMLGLGYQSPAYPGYGMTLHLPASQREFFLANAMEHQVEVRAQWYEDMEEFAKTNADTLFNTRPNYLD